MTPGWLNGYAVHFSARRVDAAKIWPKRGRQFQGSGDRAGLARIENRQALVVAAERANTKVKKSRIAFEGG
jgi:hypothetical protein